MSNNVQFDQFGRMKYHPDYHDKQGSPWTAPDQKFLINNYEKLGPEECSLLLGRTIGVIYDRVSYLRRLGLMTKPKQRRNFKRAIRGNSC